MRVRVGRSGASRRGCGHGWRVPDQLCRPARPASSMLMALMCARIGIRAGESGLASARLACSSRRMRSSSRNVKVLTSGGRPGSGIGQPLAVVLLGDHPVEGGLEVSSYRGCGVLLAEVLDGAFELAAVI